MNRWFVFFFNTLVSVSAYCQKPTEWVRHYSGEKKLDAYEDAKDNKSMRLEQEPSLTNYMQATNTTNDSIAPADTTSYSLNNIDSINITLHEVDIIGDSVKKPKRNFFQSIGKGIEKFSEFMMGCDTSYITPQLYEFTAQLELSNWHDFYHMRSSVTKNSMDIQSHYSTILGGYIYWSIFGYGYQINLSDVGVRTGENNGTGLRQTFVINTGRFLAEYYTFNSGKTAKITHVSGMDLSGMDTRFTGLNSWCTSLTIDYIFNHRHYSWPAAFGENAVQRKSCGSFKMGFSYNHQRITLNRSELPTEMASKMDTTLLFNNVEYTDFAISLGYGYNWVPKRNCLVAISLLPAIGYRKSKIEESKSKKFTLDNISTDLVTRMSIFWNNTRNFAGVVAEIHTYSYREKSFGLTNNYGSLKFICGMNFLKKSQYRKKKE